MVLGHKAFLFTHLPCLIKVMRKSTLIIQEDYNQDSKLLCNFVPLHHDQQSSLMLRSISLIMTMAHLV